LAGVTSNNNGASYTDSNNASFLHTGNAWATGFLQSNGSGTTLQVAKLATSISGGADEIRYTLDTAGVSTLELTSPNPFSLYDNDAVTGAGLWSTDWSLTFNAPIGDGDFQELNLLSSTGSFNLSLLSGQLRMRTWDSDGDNPFTAAVTNGQTVYIAGINSVATYTVSFSSNAVDLIFASSRAIPEPSTLGLLMMALALGWRNIRRIKCH
jgi:hypothetical protein